MGFRTVAVAAVAWSLAFAAIHVAWAAGSTAGLDGRRVTGVLLVIDVVAIPLCLLAAWVAWRLRDTRRAAAAPPAIRRLAVAAAVVLSLRGLGTVQALLAPPDDATVLTRLVDPYFLVGGVLFALLARRPGAAAAELAADRRIDSGEMSKSGGRVRVAGDTDHEEAAP